ncbi:MAG: hypothetical protein AB1531_07175, partial [Chloroflexota bacterium]
QLGRVLMNFGNTRASPSLALTPEAAPDIEMDTTPMPRTEPALKMDWVSVGLGLLALLAVLGLIPFWMWVYFAYNPPIP